MNTHQYEDMEVRSGTTVCSPLWRYHRQRTQGALSWEKPLEYLAFAFVLIR